MGVAQSMAQSTTTPALRLAYINEQPGLPISFEAKRGCDQIRARVYHDPRLTSQEALVALALSEFVNVHTFTAHPKQTRLAGMVKTNRTQVNRLLHRLEAKAVLVIDRHRTYCRYIFDGAWMGVFRPLPGRSRCARDAHQDVRETHITGEPYVREPVEARLWEAAAGTSRASTADRRRQEQQQRRRTEDRIEGLFAAIAPRAREAGYAYDEPDERRRLAAGEIGVEDLQRQADRLLEDVREKRLRRAHGPSYGRRR